MYLLKRLVVGTSLEAPIRNIIGLFRMKKPVSEWGLRVQRDDRSIERILSEVLKKDSNCVDVGAHKGDFLQRFLERSPDGHHYAFEPLPNFAATLKEEFPQIEIHNCALSYENGRATFYHVVERPAWSGLKTQRYPTEAQPEQFEVSIKRLDDIISSDIHIDFIKIDVEGAEYGVLKGAAETVKRCKPYILFEHAQIHTAEYGTKPEMVYDLLVNEYGLGICSLDGSGQFTKDKFVSKYHSSFASNYDRHAETNFLARPL